MWIKGWVRSLGVFLELLTTKSHCCIISRSPSCNFSMFSSGGGPTQIWSEGFRMWNKNGQQRVHLSRLHTSILSKPDFSWMEVERRVWVFILWVGLVLLVWSENWKNLFAGANIFRDRQLSVLLTMKRSEKKAAFRLQRSWETSLLWLTGFSLLGTGSDWQLLGLSWVAGRC